MSDLLQQLRLEQRRHWQDGRPVSVDEVRPAAAQALADVFGFAFADFALAAA